MRRKLLIGIVMILTIGATGCTGQNTPKPKDAADAAYDTGNPDDPSRFTKVPDLVVYAINDVTVYSDYDTNSDVVTSIASGTEVYPYAESIEWYYLALGDGKWGYAQKMDFSEDQ